MTINEPVFIELGTNLGDRLANLQVAKESVAPKVEIVRESSIYETPPWGYKDQQDFLNQVIEVRTELEPLALLRFLKHIEGSMGRVRTFRNGPRVIDLDILLYGDRVLDRAELQIPHPQIQNRAFVLAPLNELAPNLVHPVMGKTIQSLLDEVDTEGIKRL